MTRCAKPSTIAVLPTPASPSRHGIVLGAATEDLNRSFNFSLATDHRIEFAFLGEFGQVATKAIQGGRFALAAFARRAAAALAVAAPSASFTDFGTFQSVTQQVENFLADIFQLQPKVHQHLSRNTFLLTQQTQQNVFGADVAVIQIASLFHRVLDHLSWLVAFAATCRR